MLKKLVLFLVVVIAALVLVGFLLPSSAQVERSTVIEAPVCTVFTQANGFARFNEWSPWAEIDPNTVYTYEGPATGVGARMSWESEDPNVGTGSQEIVASEPYKTVKTKLDFGPNGVADAHFNLEPEGDNTRVTWGFQTDFGGNLIGRYMGLMFDKWIGADYEKGLASLKAMTEAMPKTDWCHLDAEVVEVEPVTIAYVSGTSGFGSDEIAQALGAAFGQVVGFLAQNGLQMEPSPVAIARSAEDGVYAFDAGLPIDVMPQEEVAADSPVQIGHTQGGKVVRVRHKGPYSNLAGLYEPLDALLAAHGLEKNGDSWEEYVSDPSQTPESEVITNIYQPVS